MFHIKSDKRSQTSAELIVEGLFRCVERKSFADVTISDIQRKSGVGRATFYRLFDRTEDVLAYQCDRVFSGIVQQGQLLHMADRREMFCVFFSEWTKHLSLLNAIWQCGHTEILYQTFRAYADSIGFIMSPNSELSQEAVDYMIAVLSSALVGTMTVWLDHKRNRTSEELADIFMKSIRTIEESFEF